MGETMEEIKAESLTEMVGMVFQIQGANPTPELWDKCKQAAIGEISKQPRKGYAVRNTSFYTISMPCGSYMEFSKPQNIMDLPIEDVPCGCGDKTHWFIKFRSFGAD